jgi:predicted nucleic acid-binding protein
MANVFADTSGWAHLFDPREPHHSSATAIYQNTWQQGHIFITTYYVVTELASLMISPLRISRPRIVAHVDGLRTSPYIEILHVDPTLDEQAWRLFSARQDKNWTQVDCVSFVVMQQRGITEALTTDHHFEQAGFIRLLKS